MVRIRHRKAVLLGCVLLVLAGSGYTYKTRQGGFCRPSTLRSSAGSPVQVVGDSWALGYGLPASQAWPALLHVGVDAVSGSGFIAGGYCDHQPVGARVSHLASSARLIVLAAGINDRDSSDLTFAAAVTRAVSLARARAPRAAILVLGLPQAAHPDEQRLAMEEMSVLAAGAQYVPLNDLLLPLQADQLHPTAEGQRLLTARLEPLVKAGSR
jgi:acyl-CoA thioesterase-1